MTETPDFVLAARAAEDAIADLCQTTIQPDAIPPVDVADALGALAEMDRRRTIWPERSATYVSRWPRNTRPRWRAYS